MKKLIALMLALALVLTFAACAAEEEKTNDDAAAENEQPAEPGEGEIEDENTVNPDATVAASALEVLENVWAKYGDDEKFAVIGGNMESPVDGAPGNYDMAYAENMTFNLLVPADQLANITEAASMIHMMNANTFTCGAFTLAEGVTVEDFAAVMQSAVQGNMWMCGFPENLTIANIDGVHVVVAFGVNDAMNPFKTHLAEAYPEAVTLVDEPIA